MYLSEFDTTMMLDKIANDNKLRASREKFFQNLLKSCNQLQEADAFPLALWHTDTLGLVGVIQMVRRFYYWLLINK